MDSQRSLGDVLTNLPVVRTRTAGLIQAGIARILREVGRPAFIAAIWGKIGATAPGTNASSAPLAANAA